MANKYQPSLTLNQCNLVLNLITIRALENIPANEHAQLNRISAAIYEEIGHGK